MNVNVTVDRTFDNITIVTLENGYKIRFFVRGLTDEEYIKRTRKLEKIDKKLINSVRT